MAMGAYLPNFSKFRMHPFAPVPIGTGFATMRYYRKNRTVDGHQKTSEALVASTSEVFCSAEHCIKYGVLILVMN